MDAIDLGRLRVEDDVGAAGGTVGAEVLLAKVLDLLLDGGRLLVRQLASCLDKACIATHELLLKRNLVELHLVDAGLGGADEGGRGKKSGLHGECEAA